MKQWNYRKILMAYIQHIRREEGFDFLGGLLEKEALMEFGLSQDEIAELEHVAALTANPKPAGGE